MEKGTMRENWKLPDRWAIDIYEAVDRFCAETRIRKDALAHALRIDPSSLALSHLQDPLKSRYIYQRLPYALRRDNLVSVAAALALDTEGWQALKRLVSRILAVNSGYAIDPTTLVAAREEAVDLGWLGVALLDTGRWTVAAPHLEHAWQYLTDAQPDTDGPEFLAGLRIGTQLASWQATRGQTRQSLDVVRRLLGWARRYSGGKREVLEAVSLLYKAAGTTLRHADWHPEYVVEKFQLADRIAREHGLEPLLRAAALRDQAKPIVLWGWMDGQMRRDRHAAALAALAESEQIAWERIAEERAREEWLLTRLTRVECLSAMQQGQEAIRVYDETMQVGWVAEYLNARPASPLAAKAAFAAMATRLALSDLDSVAAAAGAFRSAPENAAFGERLERAETIEQAAMLGDADALRRLMIA
jgi:hypothetical protein